MLTFVIRRIASGAAALLATLVATFLLFFAGPADPAQAMCAEAHCTAARLTEIRHSMGLDRPLPVQFGEYFRGFFLGRDITDGGNTVHCGAPCFGYSFHSHLEVKGQVLNAMPTTALLAVLSILVALVIGLGLGVYAARHRGRAGDRLVVGISQFAGAVPYFVVALLFALYLTVLHPILPRSANLSDGVGVWLLGMIAPALLLGALYACGYIRYSRAQMIEALGQDFVRTARSKGISESSVTYGHALRAALSPVVTVLGLDLAGLLGGTLVTERIFGLNGLGQLSIQALNTDDLPVIMGTVIMAAFVIVVMNMVVDVAYSFIDPRVRLA